MLFNSIDFAIFLPVVFSLYWFLANRNLRLQNILLILASYTFYGWWDWRFLSLIAFSSLIDFLIGIQLSKTIKKQKRKLLLISSILVNIGFLGFFKYFNFFAENFADAFTLFGGDFEASSLDIILPVGISFYTFQTLSYSIDVYKKKLPPTSDIISFFAFVSFFPQLVAGPIERATNLLPQFYSKRKFNYHKATDGMRQILWGLFKKIVIADNCAELANEIFNNYGDHSSASLALGAIFFTFQIYGDFSGYSDIAIGTARLFGFNLMQNFAFPYFSRDIAEFWRRWHISLSTWFRDYLYIPLGGSKSGKWLSIRNIFIIFIVSGFWHGANWTFIMWGLIHAMLYIPLFLRGKNRQYTTSIVAEDKWFPSLKELYQMGSTFFFTMIAWTFFRSNSIANAINYTLGMLNSFALPESNRAGLPFVFIILVFDYIISKDERNPISFKNRFLRYFTYIMFVYLVIAHFQLISLKGFIYFQF